jgi:hypothetical protein
MKICYTCKQNKSIDEFNCDKHCPDGLTSSCKRCLHINNYFRKASKLNLEELHIFFQKLYSTFEYSNIELSKIFNCDLSEIEYAINYFELYDLDNKRFCSKCRSWLYLDFFDNDKSNKSGKKAWCKFCIKEHRSRPSVKKQTKLTSQIYFENNREKILEANKNYYNNHVTEHSARIRFNKLRKKHATPKWADKNKIKQFYLKAKELTNLTGIPHEVDHIIPLNGLTVCGLHVENNLQILTQEENRKKFNKF